MAHTAGLPLHEYTPLNAETPQEFSGRVVDFFSDMCRWIWEVETPTGDDKIVSKFIEDHGEVLYHPLTASVMVACHGGTIRWFLYHFRNNYCQLPDKAFIRIPNTGLNSFIVTLRDGQCIKIKSITLQDLSHLQIVV
jgi:broad specificity phosphatase PhoE